jgi:16S rRNA (adenine1518-N6/adenine1519-N6)-dimethyltransferase
VPYSRLASPSATIAVLKRHGLYTRKALGQHFLVDDNVIGRILELAALVPGEPVLEVGPGIGTLTVALAEAGAAVVTVERDERLLPVLEELRQEYPGLRVVCADAIGVPAEALVTPVGAPRALVANLPYSVAATVVLRFFEEIPSLERAVVMVQAEVAERIVAEPGTKAYGAYTVKLRLHAVAGGRFRVSPSCFLPPPRVESTVIRLDRVEEAPDKSIIAAAARVADAAFSQRRKTLRNTLRSGLRIAQADADAMLVAAGIDGSLRAETLSVSDYVELGRILHETARHD